MLSSCAVTPPGGQAVLHYGYRLPKLGHLPLSCPQAMWLAKHLKTNLLTVESLLAMGHSELAQEARRHYARKRVGLPPPSTWRLRPSFLPPWPACPSLSSPCPLPAPAPPPCPPCPHSPAGARCGVTAEGGVGSRRMVLEGKWNLTFCRRQALGAGGGPYFQGKRLLGTKFRGERREFRKFSGIP